MGYNPSPLSRATTLPTYLLNAYCEESSQCKKRRRHSWSGFDTQSLLEELEAKSRTTSRESYIRKARAALTGGTMFGVGLVLIPLPIPMGAVVAGAGLSVLGKEFPAAQRFLDNTKNYTKDALNELEARRNGKRQPASSPVREETQRTLEEEKEDTEESLYYNGNDTIIFSSYDDSPVFSADYSQEDVYVNVWTA